MNCRNSPLSNSAKVMKQLNIIIIMKEHLLLLHKVECANRADQHLQCLWTHPTCTWHVRLLTFWLSVEITWPMWETKRSDRAEQSISTGRPSSQLSGQHMELCGDSPLPGSSGNLEVEDDSVSLLWRITSWMSSMCFGFDVWPARKALKDWRLAPLLLLSRPSVQRLSSVITEFSGLFRLQHSESSLLPQCWMLCDYDCERHSVISTELWDTTVLQILFTASEGLRVSPLN